MAHRALVVDDEVPLTRILSAYLRRDGFEVTLAHDGPAALAEARRQEPDVVVLDLGLPLLDGVEVCRRLRELSDCYVIMLTARAEEHDAIAGLAAGADDYLTKPFSPKLLLARIQAMLRRPRARRDTRPAEPLRIGELTLGVEARDVRIGDRRVDVTPTEFAILAALAAAPHHAFTRRELIDEIWGANWVGDEQVVDVHIGNLRKRLGDDAHAPRFVRTVRGVGYRSGAD